MIAPKRRKHRKPTRGSRKETPITRSAWRRYLHAIAGDAHPVLQWISCWMIFHSHVEQPRRGTSHTAPSIIFSDKAEGAPHEKSCNPCKLETRYGTVERNCTHGNVIICLMNLRDHCRATESDYVNRDRGLFEVASSGHAWKCSYLWTTVASELGTTSSASLLIPISQSRSLFFLRAPSESPCADKM